MDYKEKVLEHTYNKVTTEWNVGGYDMEVGTESTADGHSLYYIKSSRDPIFIQDDVYYDECIFLEKLQDLFKDEFDITILIWDADILQRIDWEMIYNSLDIKG